MPRRRTYRKRFRQRASGKGFVGGLKAAGRIGLAALRVAKFAHSKLNTERKAYDSNPHVSSAILDTGSVVSLTNIPQGDGAGHRDGNLVRFKSLLFRANFEMHASATFSQLRFILLVDKQARAGLPSVSDILDGSNILSPMNLANRYRFKVLMDKVYKMDISSMRGHIIKHYFKLGQRANYASGTTDEASYNNLVLLVISNEPTNGVTLNDDIRVRFLDN